MDPEHTREQLRDHMEETYMVLMEQLRTGSKQEIKAAETNFHHAVTLLREFHKAYSGGDKP